MQFLGAHGVVRQSGQLDPNDSHNTFLRPGLLLVAVSATCGRLDRVLADSPSGGLGDEIARRRTSRYSLRGFKYRLKNSSIRFRLSSFLNSGPPWPAPSTLTTATAPP